MRVNSTSYNKHPMCVCRVRKVYYTTARVGAWECACLCAPGTGDPGGEGLGVRGGGRTNQREGHEKCEG